MPDRSKLLSVLLLLSVFGVIVRTYQAWRDAPWNLPTAVDLKAPAPEQSKAQAGERQKNPSPEALATRNIIDKNLFDPERGMGKSRADKQAEAMAAAAQKLRSFILVGTAILGDSRYAVSEEPVDHRLQGPRPQLQEEKRGKMRRVKLGDVVEGFKLSGIEDRRAVFENGTARVEIALDYLRKIGDGRTWGPGAAPPGQQGAKVPGQGRESEAPATPLAPRFLRGDSR